MALQLKANRKYPSLPVVTDNPANHTQVLMAIKEAIEIGQRRTSDLLNSFIRVQDLIDLGLINLEGNVNSIIGTNLSQIANIGDLSGAAEGDFLRLRSGEWVNDELNLTDITQSMVTQHQAALSIAWGQLTGVPSLVMQTRQVNSGTGLTGGGDLSADRTIALDAASVASLTLADTAVQPGDLASVATSGDYGDLTGTPTIPANLVDLSDVAISSPGSGEDGYAVVWDDYSGKFILAPVGGGGGTVTSVIGTVGEIDVNSSDPTSPVLSLASAVTSALGLAGTAVQPGDLASVATSGDYGDLTGTPTIPANLVDLSDVAISSPGSGEDGYAVVWDDYSGKFILAPGGGGGGTVDTVVPDFGILVDATDPANPEVAVDLTEDFTWTGTHTFDSSVIYLSNGGDTAERHRWALVNNTNMLRLFASNDANDSWAAALTVLHGSGGVVTGLVLGNSTDNPYTEVWGNLMMRSGYFLAQYGDNSLPGISFYGDTDTGIYRPSSDALAIATGGAVAARFANDIEARLTVIDRGALRGVSSSAGLWHRGTSDSNLWFTGMNGLLDTDDWGIYSAVYGNWVWTIKNTGAQVLRTNVWHLDTSNAERLYYAASGRTYYRAPPTTGVVHEWRRGDDTSLAYLYGDGVLRLDGNSIISNADASSQVRMRADFTYGIHSIYGGNNGWTGLALYDSGLTPTFMSNGTAFGIYAQTSAYAGWYFYVLPGTGTAIPGLHHDTGFTQPYLRVMTGGANGGGRVTISTSAPSGTPADGDIWFQRAA